MKLYGFWRSSAAYRVRIALALKGLPCEAVSVHLSQGEHNRPEYGEINPQHLVPVLEDIAGWRRPAIRALFESHGLQIHEWDRTRTDRVTIREPEPARG